MLPIPAVAWPVVGSLAGGVGALWLAWTIRRYRGKPGVDWFLGVFAAQATWCLSYGVALLVTDLTIRTVLEMATWLGLVWTGIFFLGFALEYTGRADVIRGRPFAGVVAFGLLSTALLVTNPVHGAFWSGLRIDPVFGAATVSYAFGPWAYLVVVVASVLVASAAFLLVDTLLSYGPLYRHESAAVALSSLPPGIALVAWALELGPVPQLQLAPLMFVPHVVLDAYAFDRAEMFERHPTTSRAAERTAIDDLADPIVALAPDRGVVRLNPAAEAMLGVDAADARDRSLDELLDEPVRIDGGEGKTADGEADETIRDDGGNGDDSISIGTGTDRRTYAVSTSSLTDPNGTHVGYTVVFSDVTERERRRQQLEVLNRILRHNLRNDAGVVHGYGELLLDRLDDPELRRMADAIARRAGALAALGDKASTVETLLADVDPMPTDVVEVVEAVVFEERERRPDATVDFDIDGDVGNAGGRLRRDALRAIVENTIENALDHHDGSGIVRDDGGPWVRVGIGREATDGGRGMTGSGPGATEDDDPGTTEDGGGEEGGHGRLVLTIEDDGPGIPDHEVSAIESGRETALNHGSGLGMWVVEWGAAAIGADVDYADREPRGTRIRVRLPVVKEV